MRILIYFCFLLFAKGLFAQVCAPENRTEKSDELDKRKELFNVAVKTLESRELEILEARRLKEPAKTLEELSQKFSISRERVRQIENKAIKKLQEEIKNISENKMIGNA